MVLTCLQPIHIASFDVTRQDKVADQKVIAIRIGFQAIVQNQGQQQLRFSPALRQFDAI